jgi:hypothetical protein
MAVTAMTINVPIEAMAVSSSGVIVVSRSQN